jgi:predicted fused transcriptional regulator/phosphomethylpyrimidine kinase
MQAKAEEMTPEELQAYMDSIPEWKRGALVIVENDKEEEEVKGLMGRIRTKIGSKIG